MTNKSRSLSDFRRNDRGVVAITFALLATVLFTLVAMAVDLARAYNASNKLTVALDAAALAGAKLLDSGASDSEIQQAAHDFFLATVANMKIGGITLSNFAAPVDRTNSAVTTKIDAIMKTSFAGVTGKATLDLSKSSTVTYKLLDIELAMALDITGSMDSNGKISHLKNAARDVLEALLENAKTETSARVAIVPWSASVNAGTLSATVSGGASVDGCVVERTGAQAATDVVALGGDVVNAIATPAGQYACPNDPVMPLRGKSQLDAMKASVDSFNPTGWTAGHIGTAWGWYMVSPSWSAVLPVASVPAAYNPAKTLKAVLLMTDGMFNTSYLNGTGQDQSTMTTESYAQFGALCTAMKAKGIKVYTVGFELPAGGLEEQALSGCASGPSQFFMAANGNALRNAFSEIVKELTALRITR